MWQGGLGLPNRDYYFKTDEKSTRVRNAYKQYLYLNFRELGADSNTAMKKCAAIFALETRLATASRKLADLRDPNKNYNKYSWAKLQTTDPRYLLGGMVRTPSAFNPLTPLSSANPNFIPPSTKS